MSEFTLKVAIPPVHIHFHSQDDSALSVLHDLRTGIEELLSGQKAMKKIMATVAERQLALRADVEDLETADREAFERLEALIDGGGELTPEQEAEFDELERKLEAMAAASRGKGVPNP